MIYAVNFSPFIFFFSIDLKSLICYTTSEKTNTCEDTA